MNIGKYSIIAEGSYVARIAELVSLLVVILQSKADLAPTQ
jgi:hypothetical protein